eukprot:scaffold3330_cov398-Pinguiococcus_pyrenoidosus.AAC.15
MGEIPVLGAGHHQICTFGCHVLLQDVVDQHALLHQSVEVGFVARLVAHCGGKRVPVVMTMLWRFPAAMLQHRARAIGAKGAGYGMVRAIA